MANRPNDKPGDAAGQTKILDITPAVRGLVYDDPELKIGLKMSLGLAELLHEILEHSGYGGGAAVIDSCLVQAIEAAEATE